MSLQLGKTEAVICGRKCKIKNKEGFTVKCKNTTINYTTEVKYLGIRIDEALSGSGIIDTILKKCNGRIKFLYRQARWFPTALKDPVPIARPEPFRLCYILMVHTRQCHRRLKQTANYTEH